MMVEQVPQVSGGAGGALPKKVRSSSRAEGGMPADAVELSSEVMRLRGIEGIRLEKVMKIRRAVLSGTYLTSEKLDIALDRAIDDALGLTPPKR
ncbi:MAG: flagellar biosynthesis anti-sigma factor FlgM [Planctomycetota bacterium]|nr:flagellar biosynthesis anti-sigma factor FlgM [Planctomycetota bacterium]